MQEIEKPQVRFHMLAVGQEGVLSFAEELKTHFGAENFELFRAAQKKGKDISAESRQIVDETAYAQLGEMFGIKGPRIRRKFWERAFAEAVNCHRTMHRIIFPEQDRRADLVTNLSIPDYRPSHILEILTTPSREIGRQYKYEQGLILGMALLCAEVISKAEDGETAIVLREINDFLERKLFTDKDGKPCKKGDPQPYDIYSYHIPYTNELIGLSHKYPDPEYSEGLWVKHLEEPVRYIGQTPVLYDPRRKDIASIVLKVMQRSLKARKSAVEIEPHLEDFVGFRLVVAEEGRPYRNQLTLRLRELFKQFEGYINMKPDNEVDDKQGESDRLPWNREKMKVRQLRAPVEIIVMALEDYIKEEYEVGRFNKAKNMHDGLAHAFYKLGMVADIAECVWPFKLTNINHRENQKTSSYVHGYNLGIKQRISPPPYRY